MGEGLIGTKTVQEDLFVKDHCFGALLVAFLNIWWRREVLGMI